MPSLVTSDNIRTFLMDKPELNPLLRGVRWSPEEIAAGIDMVVSYFNESPPFSNEQYNPDQFPYKYILLIGVSGHLLRSAAINEASNNLNYQADGVSINDKDKAPVFLSIGNALWDEAKGMMQAIKANNNINAIYGNIESDLYYVAR